MKFIKTLLFIFLITFTTHSFAKSNEYYQQTLIHVLTECNSTCQKKVFDRLQYRGWENELIYKAINNKKQTILVTKNNLFLPGE